MVSHIGVKNRLLALFSTLIVMDRPKHVHHSEHVFFFFFLIDKQKFIIKEYILLLNKDNGMCGSV